MTRSALSHIDEALVALCDGDYAEDLATIERALGGSTSLTAIAEAIRQATAEIRQARQLMVGSNVRPAPFFLNEKTVGDILAAPVETEGKLVDRPRRSEDPSLVKANDDCPVAPEVSPVVEPAPEPVPSPDIGDAPIPDAFETPDHLSQAVQTAKVEPEDLDAERAFAQAVFGEDGFSRASHRSPKQVRAQVHKGKTPQIEIIRAAARKLREKAESDPIGEEKAEEPKPIKVPGSASKRCHFKPVQSVGERRADTPRAKKPIPPNPLDVRRARFRAAETYLRSKGVLVTVAYPDAAIRTYRVTGRKLAVLAEDVIAIAVEKGMEA